MTSGAVLVVSELFMAANAGAFRTRRTSSVHICKHQQQSTSTLRQLRYQAFRADEHRVLPC